MCNKSSNNNVTSSRSKATRSMPKKSRRKARKLQVVRKNKKPKKYLSIKFQLSSVVPDDQEGNKVPEDDRRTQNSTDNSLESTQHLNLFPLHPENLVEDKYAQEHENVAYFFSAADGGATTLTGLLDGAIASSSNDDKETNLLSPSSGSLTYAYGGQESEEGSVLVRTALRSRERDRSEEKWVCYSEVVERKEEEVTSCAAANLPEKNDRKNLQRRLSLKLDYDEILNAWSDKGSLYIPSESPQIVPDINDGFLCHDTSMGMGWGYSCGLWTVPEMATGGVDGSCLRGEDGGEQRTIGQRQREREASVLRYKEKRQSRLFAKKIRYEVRKLNAEKRPRVKGRFVKRS